MAQEEHILTSTSLNSGSGGIAAGGGANSGGGGVSSNRSKNVKQKKVPQRGLGVAQLEKIRIEEQRKREALQAANALANNAIGSATDNTQPCLAVQLPTNYSPNSVPLPQSPTNFPSPNSLYRSSFPPVPVQITKQLNGNEGEIAISSSGNSNWSRLWSGEYNPEGEKQNLGFSFRPQMNLPYESNANAPVLPLPSVPQRSYQFQRSSSSMVNASPLSSQMEPPSNQSLCGNNFTSSWPEEDKMVCMKRSYPFSLEIPPSPAFPGRFPPTSGGSRSRSDELPSCSSGQAEPRHKYMRDDPSNSSEVIRDDERLNGDFLSLAPPASASPHLDSKNKNPFDFLGSELSDFKSLPIQKNLKGQMLGLDRSDEQPFSFFPIKSQNDQAATHVRNGNGKKGGETIDLNLKL